MLIIFTCIFWIKNCEAFKGQHLYQFLLNNYNKDIPAMKGMVYLVGNKLFPQNKLFQITRQVFQTIKRFN